MDEKLLRSVHPIFQVPFTKIFVNENVQKVNTHGGLQDRILIVSNSGLFLLQERSFPRSIVVSRIIPFSQLVLMMVDEKTMQFYCGGVTMVLQHPKHVEISAIVFSIKNALFGEKPRPPKFDISEKVQERFDSSLFVFESQSLRADRFLSLCLQIPAKKLNIDRIMEYRDKLLHLTNSVKISPEIVASPLFEAYTTTIALDNDIQEITFSDVSMCSIFNSVLEIIDFNVSSKSVTFRNVSFVGPPQHYVPVTKLHIGTLNLHFLNCDVTSALFTSFLDTLTKIGCVVQTLQFSSSSFTQQSYDDLIRTLLTSNAFSKIEDFEVSKLSQFNEAAQMSILKIFSSDFLKKNKCLKTVTATDTSLHIDQMIPGIFEFDNGVEFINFSGNLLKSPTELDALNDFRQLQVLDLSRCEFTGPAIIALFSALSRSENLPATLIADSLKIDESGWHSLFSAMPTFKTHLQSLSWLENPMSSQEAILFSSFLMKQKQLIELSFSTNNCDNETIQFLAKGIKDLKIEVLTLNDEKPSSSSVAEILSNLSHVKHLTVINQMGESDRTLNAMYNLAVLGQLEELVFDGLNPPKLDPLLDFCEKVQQTNVKISQWPEHDVRTLIQREPLKNRPILMKKCESVKQGFNIKMGHRRREERRASIIPKRDECRSPEDLLSEREESIAKVIKECLGQGENDQEYTISEPLLTLFNEIQASISIQSLLSM